MSNDISVHFGLTKITTDKSVDHALAVSRDVDGSMLLGINGSIYNTPVEYLLYAIISQHPHAFSQTTFDKVRSLIEEHGIDWGVPKSVKDSQTGVTYFYNDDIVTNYPFDYGDTITGYEPEDANPELAKLRARLRELLDEAETITNTIKENHAS